MYFEAHFMLKSEDDRRICFHDVQDNEMPINPFGIESILDYPSTPLRGRSVPKGRARTSDYVESTSARKLKTKKGVLSFGAFLAYSYLCRRKDDCDAFVRQAAHLNRQKLHP